MGVFPLGSRGSRATHRGLFLTSVSPLVMLVARGFQARFDMEWAAGEVPSFLTSANPRATLAFQAPL